MNDGLPLLPVAATERALPIVVVGHVDHGKSTLVGRLLHDTGSLPPGRIEQMRAVSAKRGLDLEFSFLLDSLQVERDLGITVDAAQIWFRTAKRRYVIIDAPGHAEFLRNMITGASQADGAVLIGELGVGSPRRPIKNRTTLTPMSTTKPPSRSGWRDLSSPMAVLFRSRIDMGVPRGEGPDGKGLGNRLQPAMMDLWTNEPLIKW